MATAPVPRVRIFPAKRKSKTKGKVLELPSTLEELQAQIERAFLCHVATMTTPDKAVIDNIRLIRDDDVILFEEDLSGERSDEDLNEWVTFNVGGKLFTTSKATIVATEPNSMLSKMLANEEGCMWDNSRDASGAYLIDRTPEYFTPILNFLRTGSLVIDSNVNKTGVLEEAKFYGIHSIVAPLEEMVGRETVDGYSPISRRDFTMMLMAQPLQCQLRCQGLNFTGIDLSYLDLRYLNFRMANLTNANLTGADLSFAILERANLCGAILDESRLIGVKLMQANLEDASMIKCDFEDSHGAVANLEGANLRNADLSGSKMSGLNMLVACLKHACLKQCTLRKANLAGADLENCDLSGCDLHEVNLRGANVKEANFDSITSPLHMSQYMNTLRR